jgi:hypothetical protein
VTTPAKRDDSPNVPWWRKAAGWLSVVVPRVALALAGVGSLVVGVKAAWNSDAATPALIVAAVLLTLAVVLTPDLEELSAWFKEGGVRYRRSSPVDAAQAFAQVSDALEHALEEEGDDSLRQKIAEIATESTRAAVREAAVGESERLNRARNLARHIIGRQREASPPIEFPLMWPNTISSQRITPEAISEVRDGKAILTLNSPPSGSVTCAVTTPDGPRHTKTVFRIGQGGTGSLMLTYPDDFFGEPLPPLPPGNYRVEWIAESFFWDLASAQISSVPIEVARSEFVIPPPGDTAV